MYIIDIKQCAEISGGLTKEAIMAASAVAFIVGGTASAYVAGALGPLATFIGTPVSAIGLGLACSIPAPVVGTICCGFVGGVGGYYLSSTFATASGFVLGGALSAVGLFYQLNKHS